jgi:magnesium transporter
MKKSGQDEITTSSTAVPSGTTSNASRSSSGPAGATNRRSIRIPGPLRPRALLGRTPNAPPATGEGENRRDAQIGNVYWVDLRRPSVDDIQHLGEEFGFHELALEDTQSRVQRPKLDDFDSYLFLVLHFPVHYKVSRTTVASEVDIFVGADFLVTIHDGTLKPLTRLFERVQSLDENGRQELGATSGRLLYQVIDDLVDYCFPIVNKVGQHIDDVEELLIGGGSFETVKEISVLRRDIIALRRIIRPQIAILGLLERKQPEFLGGGHEAYFGAILDHVSKLWDVLEDSKDVVEGLSYTNDSLTSHQINEVIKILTMLSVIMLPLTLITSFYGMNVPLPLDHSPYATVFIFAGMAIVIGGMLAYFKAKRWL